MNIGIDANCLLFEKAGVGKYTQNLLKKILEIDKKNQYFLCFSFLRHRQKRIKFIKEYLGKPQPKNVKVKILPIPSQWYEFITSTPFPIDKLIREPIDLYFAPYASGIPRNGFSRMVTMIHDLAFLRFPEHRGKKLSHYYFKRHKIAVQNCQKIIAPSRATKNDLRDLLSVKLKKITIIPEASDGRFRPIKNKSQIVNITSRYLNPKISYILSVGTLEPRKNLAKLVEAYSLLPHALQKKYALVLVGGQGWNNKMLHGIINNLNLQDKVILTGFVSDEDLPYIYNKASVFVYPSLYEGFGLPLLEAMACGVPVITSNTSSLPEVANGAALFCDCQKEEEIAWAIKKVILEPKLAQKMITRGLIQAKKFSWEKAARETLEVFEEICC